MQIKTTIGRYKIIGLERGEKIKQIKLLVRRKMYVSGIFAETEI